MALTGHDATGLGTIASPYRSIQKALDVANLDAGTPHAINVAAGTYSVFGTDNGFGIGNSATPTPNRNGLTLDGGWDAAFTTQTFGSTTYIPQTNIDNSTPRGSTPDVIVYASGVTVRGFTFVFDGQVGAGGTRLSGGLQAEAPSTVFTRNTIEVGFSNGNPRSAGIVIHSPSGGSSAGVQVTNNTIVANGGAVFAFANGSTGIFVNPDTFGRVTPIIISGNDISGPNLGVGIALDRLSYVTVDGNTIQRTGAVAGSFPLIDLRQATAGLGTYGPQTGIVITNNTLDGLDGSAAGSIGIDLSARNAPIDQVTGVTIAGNFIRDVAFGVVSNKPTVQGSGVNATGNSFTGITNKAVAFTGTGTINASANWYGSSAFATVNGLISGTVDFTPYLNLGTDTAPGTTGFQGDFSSLVVHPSGAQSGATPRITEGYNALVSPGTLRVLPGTYTESVNLAAGADKAVTLAAGESPGQVTLNGNLTFSANDTLPIEIGGTNAATNYDNFVVSGTVTLGGAALSLAQFGGFSVDPGVLQAYTIVDNDGSDVVIGTFAALPEGTPIVYAGGTVYISYSGGDGNDVVLYSQPFVNGTPAADTFVFRQVNSMTGVFELSINGGAFVNLGPISGATINGLGGNDTLTVDYVHGTAVPTGGLVYNGGDPTTGPGDVLQVVRSAGAFTAGTVTHTFTSPSAGSVDVDGRVVTYTGLEPVLDTLVAGNRVFTFTGGAETIAVTDPTAADGLSRIDSTLGEMVDFANPTASLTINAGTGDDTVTITALDVGFGASLTVNGDADTDAVTLSAAITYAAGNNLTVSAETISVTGAQLLGGAGAVTLTAGQSVAISANVTGGSGGVNVTGSGTAALDTDGVTVAGGAVVTTTGNGNVVLAGTGGGGAGFNNLGVLVQTGATVSAGGSGTVTVTGFGGAAGAGGNMGVNVSGSAVTSAGGTVTVTGTGGGAGATNSNYGVLADAGGTISAGGTGAVSVAGTGGAGTGSANIGVFVTGGTITGAGTVGVAGVGGTGGASSLNAGVRVDGAGTVSATGVGGLTVTGTRGNVNAPGVLVQDAGTTVSAVGLATFNGPSASDITIASDATANFGSLTASAAGATVTVFEDSATAVNTITATTINLTSAGAISDNNVGANNLTGTTATLAAAGGIDLDTTLATLTAATSAAGAVTIDELDAITLTSVTSNNGLITITAGGTITATSVVSSTDSDANDITLTATGGGNVVVAVINAGTTAGDVFLSADTGPTGSITDDNVDTTRITADVVTLTAFVDIGLPLSGPQVEDIDTAANTILASTTNSPNASTHGIWIDELNTVTLQSVTTADGLIRITTGGATLAQSVAAAGAGRNVTVIDATGDLTVVFVTSAVGNVTLTATTGSILDDAVQATRIGGATVTLTANLGTVGSAATGDIDTAAASLTVSAGGNASVNELDGVNVNSAAVGANVFELATFGSTTQTGGITAGGFRLTGFGTATLTGANAVGTLAANRTGDLTFANVGTLVVGTVTGFTGTTVGVTVTGATDVSTGNAGSSALLTVASAVSGSGNVVLTSDQDFTLNTGVTVASTGGTVAVNADLGVDLDTTGATVNINGPITSASVAPSAVTINTGGDADTITVTQTGASNLDVFGGGIVAPAVGFDQVTVVFGNLGAGFVRLSNSGSDNYHATVDGAAQTGPLTIHANTLLNELNAALPSTASGVRRVSVNAATVLDYIPAGATLTELSLLGGTAADTYFVQFTDTASNALSLLPALVNVTANGAADAARVYGTSSPDTIGVNTGDNDRVTSAGVAVQYDGNLEALTVYGKGETGQPGDTFAVRPDQQTAITIHGGTPIIYPGDTLDLDVVGLVTLNPTLSDPALPDGTLSLTGYPTPALAWDGIENFPVPRGLGGSFDFGPAGGPVQFGFTQVLPSRSYPAAATEGTGWHGWATTPQYGNQAYNETNLSPALAASPIVNLLRDYAYGFQTALDVGVFRVDVAPNKPVQLTAILGIPAGGRDGQVVEWGVANTPTGLPTTWTAITPLNGTFTAAGEMTSVSAILTAADIGSNLSLFVRFRDLTGEPFWSVSALDVRPTNPAPGMGNLLPGGLVAPLPVRREFSTDGSQPAPGMYANQPAFAALAADGATIDYYRGMDAIPNSLVTVTVTNGTPVDAAFTAADMALGTRVLNADAAGYFRSFQVQADAVGEFTFGVRRPTGTATSTITIADPTGFRAGAFTQAFTLPTTRRIDFGPLPATSTADYGNGGTVGVGYTPFATAAYSAATALGWSAAAPLPVAFTPGGTGVNAVQTDGVFGGYAPSEFALDMPEGSYVVTATLADAAARRDDLFVEVFNGTTWVPAKAFNPASGAYDSDLTGLTSPAGVSPNAGMSMVRTFVLPTSGNVGGVGQLRVRFGNVTGNPNWSLSALDVRPAQAGLTVTRTSAAPTADGTSVTTYDVTGAAPGTVLTVRPALGAPVGDANTTYDGSQVVVPMSGTATFSVTAPFSTTIVTSIIEVESVSGAERGTATESYAASPPPPPASTPSVRRFDFNGAANDTNPNMLGVRGSEVWTTGADYGWLSAVGEFERTVASMPASMTAAQKSLFRDGATLGGPTGTFRVKVPDAGPTSSYAVRYYVGDSAKKWPWIRLQVEGGAASGQLATNVNQYWSYVRFGNDANNDGYLDVSVFGSATWVLNAIDVARGGTAAALPPSLIPPAPQLAGFAVTSGTAPTLTAAELAPVVAEATRRWVAAGADPARLANVTVSITDLNAAGRLGEHVPGSVHIDDDAGGKGWFVDATPGDDAEFGSAVAVGLGATDGAAARGVDLLTVVMHELGHELGLDDVDPSAAPADLMAETLTAGVRRLPAGLSAAVVPADGKVELPARPTAKVATAATTFATLPMPALWLDKAETVYSPGVPVVATDDRVQVTAAEPVFARTESGRVALPPVLSTAAAWPDADALLDIDGVYVG